MIAASFNYEDQKHQIIYALGDNEMLVKLRLPVQYSWNAASSRIINNDGAYLIVIVESGQAALAYCEADQIIEHKVLKAYMVRKKQGKSQIKYLKTRGKSKAGSRVRLANTEHFFEEIHERINDWLSYFEIKTVALSCSKTLYPYLFTSEFALDRKDERILKIPKHIPEANFDNLLKVHQFLTAGELQFSEDYAELVEKLNW